MKEKASVTVYFSLIFMILLAVITTTVESARLAGIRVRCQSAAALGLESLFADYAAPLFEEYGLLFLESSYGTGEKEAYLEWYRDYVSYNVDCNKELLLMGGDFYCSELAGVSAEAAVYATDQEGNPLEEQICAAVLGDIPVNFLEELLEKLELNNQSGLLTKLFDGVNQISDKVSKVDKAVQQIYEKVEALKSFRLDFEEETEDLRDLIESLESARQSYEHAETPEEEEEAWQNIRDCEQSIAALRKEVLARQEEMQKLAKTAVDQEKIYTENTKKVAEKLKKLHQELLEENAQEVKTEIAEAIEKQISDLMRYSGGEGDFYQADAAKVPLQSCKEILEANILAIKAAGSNENQLLAVLESRSDSLNKLNISQLEILFDNSNQGESQKGILQGIKNLISQGITGFVMEGKEISSASLDGEELPSKEYGKETGFLTAFKELLRAENLPAELLETGKDTVLTDEYVLRYFSTVAEEIEHVLSYEAEYVLNGKLSDQENLEETIQQLVLLRTGMNLIYLLSDTESCAQAQEVAMAVVGFTGMMGLVRVTQLILLAAWAYAEALLDVRGLVNGGKVPFLKTKADWKLSISNLGNFGKEGVPATENSTGLSYQYYLHILLLKENQSNKLYRIMDLLQVNLRHGGWDGFLIGNCICALQLKTDFTAQPLFLNLSPSVYWGSQSEGYKVQTIQSYAY